MSCKCPLRHPATKRIGVTPTRRPSSSIRSARPRGFRSRQRTSRRRCTSPASSASRATNQAGKIRASTPGGSPAPVRPSSSTGGVRKLSRTPSASRPLTRSSASSTATARGSCTARQLPRSRMCHRSSPPTMTERVGRSTIAPGPKPSTSCDCRSVTRLALMPYLLHPIPARHPARAAGSARPAPRRACSTPPESAGVPAPDCPAPGRAAGGAAAAADPRS